jgi:hypothetical protein
LQNESQLSPVIFKITDGIGFTVIVTVSVDEHPPSIPVKVYVVVVVGEIAIEEVVWFPGIQLYVVAPVADNVAVIPWQIVVAFASIVIDGSGFTVIVTD